MKKAMVTFVALAAVIGFSGMAAAQSTPDSTQGDGSVAGGGVSNTNITATQDTANWAGFYGTLDANLELNDGSTFYSWTGGSVDGSAILASNDGFSGDQADLSAVSDPLTLSGVPDSGLDNISNTYDGSADLAVLNPGATASTTYSDGSADSFTNFVYDDTANSNSPVYAAEAKDDAQAFNGESANYQLLVDSTNDTTSIPYSFYVEIN